MFFCMTLCLHLTLLQSATTICDLVENTVLERKSVYAHQLCGMEGKVSKFSCLVCIKRGVRSLLTN